MMDWDKLRIFHAVATAESLTRAGEQLNVSQSAVSRQISALEESLQVSLFNRHARGLMLTEQGEILFRTVTDILNRLSTAENILHDSKERPKGPLRITAPTAIGTLWLTPHMREFCEKYPDIKVTLLVEDRELDLIKREADVALRLFPARQGDLVEKKLTSFNNSLYASSDYLRQHGKPKTAQDLSEHQLIAYAEKGRLPFIEINWCLKAGLAKGETRQPFFYINSMRGMAKAVESGIGIAGLPDYMAQDLPGVVRVIPELKGPVTDLYYTYSMERRDSKRVRVLKEFLIAKLADEGLKQAA
jgi:DNA-binding transcriptional LysR family regulator